MFEKMLIALADDGSDVLVLEKIVDGAACAAVADQLIAGGIKAIWTFAPAHLEVPDNILVQYENMATSLAVLSVHLQAQIKEEKGDA